MKHIVTLLALCALFCVPSHAAVKKPLKVFILAGQSNMEGHAKVDTFDYIGDDPATAPLLKLMRGADGKPTVCEGAWISYFTGSGDRTAKGPVSSLRATARGRSRIRTAAKLARSLPLG